MAGQSSAATRCEQAKALAQVLNDLGRGQQRGARCSQLDCQGNSIKTPTDLGDRGAIRFSKVQARSDGPGPVDEEADCLARGKLDWSQVVVFGQT